jgi:Na+/phosphate symporter
MKKILLPLFSICLLASCKSGSANNEQEEKANKLQKEVLAEHDIAMPKSMKIPNLQKEVTRLLDSLAGLPEKAKEAAAPLKTKLEGLKDELSYAETAMDKWMVEFDLDSFKKDAAKRIQYLMDEKLKVGKVKEAVLNGLAKADSLLRR